MTDPAQDNTVEPYDMPWWRAYNKSRTDQRLHLLTDAQHRVWYNLMCYASEQRGHRGLIDKSRAVLAAEVARGNAKLLNSTLEKLALLEIVRLHEDGAVEFIDFQKEQERGKPSNSPERTKARVDKSRGLARQRRADQAQALAQPVAGAGEQLAPVPVPAVPLAAPPAEPEETDADSPVTPCNAPVTPRIAIKILDLDQDIDLDSNPDPRSPRDTHVYHARSQNAVSLFPSPEQDGQDRASPTPTELIKAFDFRAYWARVERDAGAALSMDRRSEERVIRRLIVLYPQASPGDFADFLRYKRACWRSDELSEVSFVRYQTDFGKWFLSGKRTSPAPNGARQGEQHATSKRAGPPTGDNFWENYEVVA